MNGLSAELKEGGDKIWVMSKPLKYYSELLKELIIIPQSFETDFASVPRLPIAYAAWGDKAHREAVVHDYLYRIDSKPLVTRSQANSIFLEAMNSTEKSWYIKYPMYMGVVLGGWATWHKRKVMDRIGENI